MKPRKIKRRVDKLFAELCKEAVAKETSTVSLGNNVDIVSFTATNKWACKTYAQGTGYGHHQSDLALRVARLSKLLIHDDLKSLEGLGKIEIYRDFSTSGFIRIPNEQVIEFGKSWWEKMWESQPATSGTLIVSLISILISCVALYVSFKKQ